MLVCWENLWLLPARKRIILHAYFTRQATDTDNVAMDIRAVFNQLYSPQNNHGSWHNIRKPSGGEFHMMTSSNGNFSALLALCVGTSPVISEFPSQRPVMRSFDVFFDLRLNKQLSKQSWGWLFEKPSRSLWCHCNDLWIITSNDVLKERKYIYIFCNYTKLLKSQRLVQGWVSKSYVLCGRNFLSLPDSQCHSSHSLLTQGPHKIGNVHPIPLNLWFTSNNRLRSCFALHKRRKVYQSRQ